jgi:hypothetical protein
MAILYSKVQRINPQDREAEKKWYIVPNRVEQKDMDIHPVCLRERTVTLSKKFSISLENLRFL